jgi:starvation-inducible DNA-binding protein
MINQEMRMFETRIDLNLKKRQEMIDVLNAQLADTFNMFSFMKHAHWNVKGPQFIALHELFDEIATGLLVHVDEIAERATALGGMALGTTRIASESSRLEAYPLTVVDSIETVLVLANRMAQLAANVRSAAKRAEELEDMDTNDLFTGTSRDLDRWLWFLEAHLQK